MSRKPYPSDLTDAQWEELATLLPPDTTRGHPRTTVKLVLAKLLGRFPRLRMIWADAGYAGQLVAWA